LLVFDLGQGFYKPWLLIRLLTNPVSVMTWGTWILSFFIVVSLLKAFFAWKKKNAPAILTYAGAILALATGAYTGLLLADARAIAFWSTMILPVFFVLSALSTGMSATVLLAPYIEKGPVREGKTPQAHLLLVVLEIVVAAVFFGMMLSGAKGTIAAQSAQMVITGQFALVFWLLFVVVGLIFPTGVYAYTLLKHRQAPLPVRDAVPAVSIADENELAAADEHAGHPVLTAASDAAAIVGGLALRYLIIFAALPIWDGITI